MPSYQQFASAPVPRQKGMTLIEGLSVVSIIALSLTIAAPAVHDLSQRWGHTTTEMNLQAFLRQSRAAAVSSLRDVVVCGVSEGDHCKPDGEWHQGVMSFVDNNENHRRDSGDELVRVFAPRAGNIRSAKESLLYNALGGGDMGRLEVCTNLSSGYSLSSIYISLSGRSRVSNNRFASGRCPG